MNEIDLLKKRISETRLNRRDFATYSDKRQHGVDDQVASSQLIVVSILLPLSLGMLSTVMTANLGIRLLYFLGLLSFSVSLIFGVIHLQIKNKFWKENGDKFTKIFDIWTSAEDGSLASEDVKVIKALASQAKMAEEAILGGNNLTQKGWASRWQYMALIFGMLFEILALGILVI